MPDTAPLAPIMGTGEEGWKGELGCAGCQAGAEVEQEKLQVSGRILHVIAEDPEIQHVSGQMKNPAVVSKTTKLQAKRMFRLAF